MTFDTASNSGLVQEVCLHAGLIQALKEHFPKPTGAQHLALAGEPVDALPDNWRT
jgi:hypothetical protein